MFQVQILHTNFKMGTKSHLALMEINIRKDVFFVTHLKQKKNY